MWLGLTVTVDAGVVPVVTRGPPLRVALEDVRLATLTVETVQRQVSGPLPKVRAGKRLGYSTGEGAFSKKYYKSLGETRNNYCLLINYCTKNVNDKQITR